MLTGEIKFQMDSTWDALCWKCPKYVAPAEVFTVVERAFPILRLVYLQQRAFRGGL
jgi:hypothetical protein